MGLLLLVMTVGGTGLALILLLYAVLTKKDWLKNFVLSATAAWFVFYAVALVTTSLASREKTLNPGEPKAFCGAYIDCHVHAAVTGVRKTKQIGDRPANGEFYVVKVKVFSDARRVALGLHAPEFTVIDADNRRFGRLAEFENPTPPFDEKVPAGGAFEKEIVFDLPADVQNPRLDVAEGIGIDKFIEAVLIGDEDSLFHKRKRFTLEPRTQTASAN